MYGNNTFYVNLLQYYHVRPTIRNKSIDYCPVCFFSITMVLSKPCVGPIETSIKNCTMFSAFTCYPDQMFHKRGSDVTSSLRVMFCGTRKMVDFTVSLL